MRKRRSCHTDIGGMWL